ncbi:MAG: tetratricopeptide repeat protein [Patescibacteria group bacterium]
MRRALPWIGIITLTLLVYARSLGNDFVTWDDRLLIVDNPIVHGLSWANIVAAFTTYDPEIYIPLTFLSYQINYMIGGLQPFGYHLVNLLLHMGNAILVGILAGKLLNGKLKIENGKLFSIFHFQFSILVALLFAVHPLHTEAVVWAAARKDVLSTFFLLMSVWLYLGSKENTKKYWLSVAVFALALLSKVSVIMWPLLIPMLDWYRGETIAGVPHPRRGAARSLQRAIPYAVLSLVFGVLALGGKIANTGFLYEKILIGCRAVTLLLQKFFWPVHLSALYPFTKPISITTPELGLSVLFVLFVFFFLIWLAWKKHTRLPLFAWTWFLLFLAPSMTNILKGHNELLDIYVTSDRYAYLPSLGLLLVAGWLVARWMQRYPKAVSSVVLLVLFVFSVLSYRQSLTWKNTLTLFTHVSAVQPNSYVAWNNIGTEYVHQGRLNDGLQAYGKALAIRNDATTWFNVGQILRAQGKIDLAIRAYEKAVESSPLEEDAKRALEELKMEN